MTQPGCTSGCPPFRMCTSEPHTFARIIESTRPPAGGSGTSYSRAAVDPTASSTVFRPVTMHTHLIVWRRRALRCRPGRRHLRRYSNIFGTSRDMRIPAPIWPEHPNRPDKTPGKMNTCAASPLTLRRSEIYLPVRRGDRAPGVVTRRARSDRPSTTRQRKIPMATAPDMKVHILDTGTMEADRTWLLLAPHSVIKTREHKNDPRAWGQVPTHAVYIDHPDGKILWDTGVPRN